jgi:DNA-binding CsgD family transcriptional regulator
MLEMFRCEPFDCRLTRKACAERHRAANRKASGPGAAAMEAARHRGSPCTDCEVGRAHASESNDAAGAVDAPRASEEAIMGKAGHGERQRQVLELVRQEPGLHAKEVALRLDMGINNSGTVLRRLMERGHVRFEGEGRKRTWFPVEDGEGAGSPGVN